MMAAAIPVAVATKNVVTHATISATLELPASSKAQYTIPDNSQAERQHKQTRQRHSVFRIRHRRNNIETKNTVTNGSWFSVKNQIDRTGIDAGPIKPRNGPSINRRTA